MTTAHFERTDGGAAAPKPRRSRGKSAGKRAKGRPAAGRAPGPAPREGGPWSGGPWSRALRAGFLGACLGLAVAAASVLLAGHAPSWRSLSVVALQSAPLLPGLALLWRALEWARARAPGAPLLLWLGLAMVGAAAVMLLAPGSVFAVQGWAAALAEDHDEAVSPYYQLLGVAAAFYLYATTAARLWWPWGAAIPLMMAGLFWRAHRR